MWVQHCNFQMQWTVLSSQTTDFQNTIPHKKLLFKQAHACLLKVLQMTAFSNDMTEPRLQSESSWFQEQQILLQKVLRDVFIKKSLCTARHYTFYRAYIYMQQANLGY